MYIVAAVYNIYVKILYTYTRICICSSFACAELDKILKYQSLTRTAITFELALNYCNTTHTRIPILICIQHLFGTQFKRFDSRAVRVIGIYNMIFLWIFRASVMYLENFSVKSVTCDYCSARR